MILHLFSCLCVQRMDSRAVCTVLCYRGFAASVDLSCWLNIRKYTQPMDFPSYFSSQCYDFHHTNASHLYIILLQSGSWQFISIFSLSCTTSILVSKFHHLRLSVFASIKDQFTVHYSKGSVKRCNAISFSSCLLLGSWTSSLAAYCYFVCSVSSPFPRLTSKSAK